MESYHKIDHKYRCIHGVIFKILRYIDFIYCLKDRFKFYHLYNTTNTFSTLIRNSIFLLMFYFRF